MPFVSEIYLDLTVNWSEIFLFYRSVNGSSGISALALMFSGALVVLETF